MVVERFKKNVWEKEGGKLVCIKYLMEAKK